MNKTLIEWVKNPDGTQGYTWNPITGCLNGCPYCYARKLANGRLRSRYLANYDTIPYENEEAYMLNRKDPFYPRFWENRLEQVTYFVKHPTHKGIFVCDMGELFGDWIPKEWQEEVFDVIEAHPWHRFYLLTKQPQNLIKFSPFPDNCYVGVTATNPEMTKNACYYLREIEAKVKFISFEPLLTDVAHIFFPEYVDWVIIGAQTKPYKPPKISWVEEIVRACDKAGVPVFLKDNLYPLIHSERTVADRKWLGRDGVLRQEMPNELAKE